jgi:hypothetical protein
MLVSHTCNRSHLGGRDQEDCGSKPAQANSSQDLISKNTFTFWLVECLKVKTLSSNSTTEKKFFNMGFWKKLSLDTMYQKLRK